MKTRPYSTDYLTWSLTNPIKGTPGIRSSQMERVYFHDGTESRVAAAIRVQGMLDETHSITMSHREHAYVQLGLGEFITTLNLKARQSNGLTRDLFYGRAQVIMALADRLTERWGNSR